MTKLFFKSYNVGSGVDPVVGNIFYPATGYRYTGGALLEVISPTNYWSSTASSAAGGVRIFFAPTQLNPYFESTRFSSSPIRCVKE